MLKSKPYPATLVRNPMDYASGRSQVIKSERKGRAAIDVQSLLEPVQDGLRQVEVKMKGLDTSLFAPLADAFVDLIGSGGKRLRPALALLAADFNGPLEAAQRERVVALAASVEMLHTATLVHDDVIDDALLRRGAPTLNARWTKGSTVLAGNYMFGRAAHFAAETDNMRVIHIFSDTLRTIVNGELRQLFARFQYGQEKGEYYERIFAKTASLFCAATEGAAVLSGLAERDVRSLREYGYNLGMAFQIVDDILDFTGNERSLGKPAGSDLRQGTLTLPFFYYLRQHPAADAFVATLQERQEQAELDDPAIWRRTVAEVVAAVQASDAVAQAHEEALELLELARGSLAELPENESKRTLLGLCDFVVQRTY